MSRLPNLLRADEIDPESRNRFLLIGGMVAIVVFALGLIAVGYYVDRIAPRGDTVFTVGDRGFSYAYLEDRVDAADAEGRFNRENVQLGIAQMVADIQNEELVRLMAAEDGVTVTPEELDLEMRAAVGVPADAERNIFAIALRNRLQLLGLSLERYEEITEVRVLEQKLQDRIKSDLPAEVEQVNLTLIFAETDAAAATAKQRIEAGETFEEVAAQVSRHASAADGGVLGWTPREVLVDDVADAAFSQEPGTISDVIETESGFYILKVDGKEVRELEDNVKTNLASTRFGDRLEAASQQYQMENRVTFEHAQRIANHLRSTRG